MVAKSAEVKHNMGHRQKGSLASLGDPPQRASSASEIDPALHQEQQRSTSFLSLFDAITRRQIFSEDKFFEEVGDIAYYSLSTFVSKEVDHHGRPFLSGRIIENILSKIKFPCAISFLIESNVFYYVILKTDNPDIDKAKYKRAIEKLFDFTKEYRRESQTMPEQAQSADLKLKDYGEINPKEFIDDFVKSFFEKDENTIFSSNNQRIRAKFVEEVCELIKNKLPLPSDQSRRLLAIKHLIDKNIFGAKDLDSIKKASSALIANPADKINILEAWSSQLKSNPASEASPFSGSALRSGPLGKSGSEL